MLTLGALHLAQCPTPCLAEAPSSEVTLSTGATCPLEPSSFELKLGPIGDDTPGVLKYGWYLWKNVMVSQHSYRAADRQKGGALVEIVRHDVDYPYVIKDFFGTFRAAAAGHKNYLKTLENTSVIRSMVQEANGQWKFVDWTTEDGDVSGKVCLFLTPEEETAFGGIAGWYRRADSHITTVMIRFSKLRGVPRQLVDKYLKEYSSSVGEEDFHGDTWVADDVRKLIHLLELRNVDRAIRQVSWVRLKAYDSEVFGVEPAGLESPDPDVFQRTIQDLKTRAERWLQNRERENAGPGNP
jgi:hypothetical protein